MAGKYRVKLEARRSPLLVKLVVAVAILLSLAALVMVHGAIAYTKSEQAAYQQDIGELAQERSRLEQYIQELGTVQGIIRIAQEKLGLIDPDTIIFQPEE